MRKLTYFAVFEPDGNGGYGVFFPDIPGCTSFGESFEQAQKMSQEALGLHVYEMENDGDVIPAPTTDPAYLEIDAETEGNYIVSSVTVFPDLVKDQLDNRAIRTNTTLPAWLKELAEERGVNFSHLLQASLKEHLGLAQ
jgi:predicted RNase H-like HicB family nuclease